MIGYKRIVKTLGERLGKHRLVPAQGGAALLLSAIVIGIAGFTGGPVSTIHVVTSGSAGTMVGSGAGVQPKTRWQIAAAWVLSLPYTTLLSRLFSQSWLEGISDQRRPLYPTSTYMTLDRSQPIERERVRPD